MFGSGSGTSLDSGQRTAEIGVRLALGAEPRRIMHMIVGQGTGRASPLVTQD